MPYMIGVRLWDANDSNYFSKLFRRKYGLSPRAYRKAKGEV